MKRRDAIVASLCETALILVAGLAAFAAHRPLFFASLGPTAYELVETPHSPSARPYNVVAGHLIGVLCGFTALWITHAWNMPAVSTSNISIERVFAAALAALPTVLGTLLARAQQPAALSTTLLIATGTMQRLQDGISIMLAILLLTAVGAPLRHWRLRTKGNQSGSSV